MTDIHNPQQNKLLKALPIEDYERILVHLELTEMSPGEILFHSGEKLEYVYFPTDCFMSLLYDTEEGATTEIASIGNDGVVGVGIFMTGAAMPFRAMVQSTGCAYRISQNLFMEEFRRQGSLYHKLLSYTQVLITQTAQMAGLRRVVGALSLVNVWWNGIECFLAVRIFAAEFAAGPGADLSGGAAGDDLLAGVLQQYAGPGNGRNGLRTVWPRVHRGLDRTNRGDDQQSDRYSGGDCHQPVVPHRGALALGHL